MIKPSTEVVEVLLGDEPQLEVTALDDYLVKCHGSFGRLVVGEQDHSLSCLAFSHEAELDAAPDKVVAFEDLFDVPVVEGEGESAYLDGCLCEEGVSAFSGS